MNSYGMVFGVIFVASLALTFGIGLLRRLTRKRHAAREPWTLDASVFGFFAALYAFFLGFCVVTLWNAFSQAKIVAAGEANALQAAGCQSLVLPGTDRFRLVLSEYLEAVIGGEWAAMDRNGTMSPRAREHFNRLWEAYRDMTPPAGDAACLYAGIARSLEDAARFRKERALLLSGNIYPPLWVIIFFGLAGMGLAFYCADPGLHRGQALMMFVVFFMVLSCIYFIYDISTPFSGILNVPPDFFQAVLDHLRRLTPPAGGAGSLPRP
jgi:hypothetical protein